MWCRPKNSSTQVVSRDVGRKREGKEALGYLASECGCAPDGPIRNSEFNRETHFTVPHMKPRVSVNKYHFAPLVQVANHHCISKANVSL